MARNSQTTVGRHEIWVVPQMLFQRWSHIFSKNFTWADPINLKLSNTTQYIIRYILNKT